MWYLHFNDLCTVMCLSFRLLRRKLILSRQQEQAGRFISLHISIRDSSSFDLCFNSFNTWLRQMETLVTFYEWECLWPVCWGKGPQFQAPSAAVCWLTDNCMTRGSLSVVPAVLWRSAKRLRWLKQYMWKYQQQFPGQQNFRYKIKTQI